MSLTISGNDPTSRLAPTSGEPKKTEENAKKHADFDFAGVAYSAVHLPTGLIAAAPTKAQVVRDLKDTAAAGKKVLEDLKSPELRELLKSGGEVALDGALLTKDLYDLVEDGAEACEGSPIGIAKFFGAVGETIKDSVELGIDARKLDKANTPEAREKLNELLHDLAALGKKATSLEADMIKLTGAAPVRFATTGRI